MKKNEIIDKWIIVNGTATFNSSINDRTLNPYDEEYRSAYLSNVKSVCFKKIDHISSINFITIGNELCISKIEIGNESFYNLFYFENNNRFSVKAIYEFKAKSLSELFIKLELEGFLFDEPAIKT